MDIIKLQEEIAAFEAAKEELENQIRELESKKNKVKEEIYKRRESIERNQYHGLKQYEYFEKISNTEFEEDGFKILIGSPYGGYLTVRILDKDGETDISATGSCAEEGCSSMYVYRPATKEKKFYDKKYHRGEIPKSRQALWIKMSELKDKYGKMMLDAEIPMKESVEK